MPAPVLAIDGNRVHRRRNRHPGAHLDHALGKGQVRRAGIDAAVDMRLRDIHKTPRPLLGRHRADDPHGLGGGRPVPAIEDRAILPGQDQRRGAGGLNRNRQIAGRDPIQADPRRRLAAQHIECRRRQAQDRQRLAEHLGGDQGAQGDHILGLGKDQGRRAATRQDQIQQHPRSRAGSAGRGHHQDAPGNGAPLQRVMHVDDPAGGRIHPAPEAERFVRKQDGPVCDARQDAGCGHGHLLGLRSVVALLVRRRRNAPGSTGSTKWRCCPAGQAPTTSRERRGRIRVLPSSGCGAGHERLMRRRRSLGTPTPDA